MDAMECITTRRSIRKYKSQVISDSLIKELIEAAMMAPSAGNQQPWHFIVIDDHEILEHITEFHPHAFMLKDASVAILVCGDMDLEMHKGYWVQDCSAATENLLLAAHAKGLGAVWLGTWPNEERVAAFKKLLAIPERINPLALISLGYPAEEKETPERYKEERVHKNSW